MQFSQTNFTRIPTYKTHDHVDHQLTIGSFLPAIALMGKGANPKATFPIFQCTNAATLISLYHLND